MVRYSVKCTVRDVLEAELERPNLILTKAFLSLTACIMHGGVLSLMAIDTSVKRGTTVLV